jgi:hypothetical protein
MISAIIEGGSGTKDLCQGKNVKNCEKNLSKAAIKYF